MNEIQLAQKLSLTPLHALHALRGSLNRGLEAPSLTSPRS